MIAFRAIFLLAMTWLLVVFLPGHTRGELTIGPPLDEPTPAEAPSSCCAGHDAEAPKDGEPDADDRARCAVCFWAAGLLSTPPVVFENAHAERALETARQYHAQVRRLACRLTRFGRDPPIDAVA